MSKRRAADDKKCLTIVIKPTCERRMLSGCGIRNIATYKILLNFNLLSEIVTLDIDGGEHIESLEWFFFSIFLYAPCVGNSFTAFFASVLYSAQPYVCYFSS